MNLSAHTLTPLVLACFWTLALGQGAKIPAEPIQGDQSAKSPRPPVTEKKKLTGHWQNGRVLFSGEKQAPLPPIMVVAKGAKWPDGSRIRKAKVQADGTFHIGFAPGTERGLVTIEGAHGLLSRGMVWRPWFQHEMLIRAFLPRKIEVQVLEDKTEPLQNLRVWTRKNRWFQVAEEQTLTADKGLRFSYYSHDSPPHEVIADADHHVRTRWVDDDEWADSEATKKVLQLGKEARISGAFQIKGTALYSRHLAYISQPARHANGKGEAVSEYLRTWFVEDGQFDLLVPSGARLDICWAVSGSQWQYQTIQALDPGEHRSGIQFDLETGPDYRGRILNAKGEPVPNAQVTGLKQWFTDQLEMDPPGMYMPYRARTDAEGRFQLAGFFRDKQMNFMVASSSQPEGDEPHPPVLGEDPMQWYEAKLGSDSEQELVLAPTPTELNIQVTSGDGQPVQEFVFDWIQTDRKPPTPLGCVACGSKSAEAHIREHWAEQAMRARRAAEQAESQPVSPTHIMFRREYTSANGAAHLPRMPEGEWHLTVTAPGFAPTTIPHLRTPETKELSVVMRRPASLTVELSNGVGTPVEGLGVFLRAGAEPKGSYPKSTWIGPSPTPESDEGEMDRRLSDSSGRIHFSAVSPERVRIEGRSVEGKLFTPKTVDLQPGRSHHIKLQAAPMGSVLLHMDPDLDEALHRKSSFTKYRPILTPINGKGKPRRALGYEGVYFWPELPVGTYSVRFGAGSNRKQAEPLYEELDIAVRPRQTTRGDLRLALNLCKVSGTVSVNGAVLKQGQILFAESKSATSPRQWISKEGGYQAQLRRGATYFVKLYSRKTGWTDLGSYVAPNLDAHTFHPDIQLPSKEE